MTEKNDEEKKFWKEEIGRYVDWYRGRWREMYGILAPKPYEKITHLGTEELNAIETWINCDKWRYCKRLFVEPTYFSGKHVLEVGSGPLGLSRFFAGATMISLDPLHSWYRECGYRVDENGADLLEMHVEDLNESAAKFDAIISVNAIDHVEDFEIAIAACEEVCELDGEIRIECHYHAPTTTEPIVLNDDRVSAAFKRFAVKKIADNPSSVFYPPGTHPKEDRFTVWSNRLHKYDGVRSLK